ncbi:MAG: glutamate racemase [Campylobacteraceae bacterium]|nr:glutamate racemase [Campylobacteraceae bacterium]
MNVGIFDSGLGGLSVVREISQRFKGLEIFYLADTAYAPYGDKSKEKILARCIEITYSLIKKHKIDALVLACNTATSVAIKELRILFPSMIVIGCEPGLKPATALSKSSKIGVLATSLTLKGQKYQDLEKQLSLNKNVSFFEQACPGLVEKIEEGNISKTKDMLRKWLLPMKDKNVDTIVLGCTHYSLVSEIIKQIMQYKITLIETSKALANRLMELSLERGHLNEGLLTIKIFYTGKININMVNMIFEKQEKMILGKYKI